jgi:hypothetical protein
MVFAVAFKEIRSLGAVRAGADLSFLLLLTFQHLSVPRSLAMRLAVDSSMIALVVIPMVFA